MSWPRQSFSLKANERYVFEFEFGTWVLKEYPTRELTAAQATANLARPTSPHIVVTISDGDWLPEIKLPESAEEWDKITIRSTATQPTMVSGNIHRHVEVHEPPHDVFPAAPGVKPPQPSRPAPNPVGEQLASVEVNSDRTYTFSWNGSSWEI